MPPLHVQRLAAADVRPLRQAVLRPHERAEDLVWDGDDDPRARHVGAFDGERLVGVGSLVPDGGMRIRGMAVLPDARGGGAGAAILDALLAAAGGRVWCTARTSALGFWERAGFVAEGEPFELPHIGEHVVMALARQVEPEQPRQ